MRLTAAFAREAVEGGCLAAVIALAPPSRQEGALARACVSKSGKAALQRMSAAADSYLGKTCLGW